MFTAKNTLLNFRGRLNFILWHRKCEIREQSPSFSALKTKSKQPLDFE